MLHQVVPCTSVFHCHNGRVEVGVSTGLFCWQSFLCTYGSFATMALQLPAQDRHLFWSPGGGQQAMVALLLQQSLSSLALPLAASCICCLPYLWRLRCACKTHTCFGQQAKMALVLHHSLSRWRFHLLPLASAVYGTVGGRGVPSRPAPVLVSRRRWHDPTVRHSPIRPEGIRKSKRADQLGYCRARGRPG
jgi:hypothetical protein